MERDELLAHLRAMANEDPRLDATPEWRERGTDSVTESVFAVVACSTDPREVAEHAAIWLYRALREGRITVKRTLWLMPQYGVELRRAAV